MAQRIMSFAPFLFVNYLKKRLIRFIKYDFINSKGSRRRMRLKTKNWITEMRPTIPILKARLIKPEIEDAEIYVTKGVDR